MIKILDAGCLYSSCKRESRNVHNNKDFSPQQQKHSERICEDVKRYFMLMLGVFSQYSEILRVKTSLSALMPIMIDGCIVRKLREEYDKLGGYLLMPRPSNASHNTVKPAVARRGEVSFGAAFTLH